MTTTRSGPKPLIIYARTFVIKYPFLAGLHNVDVSLNIGDEDRK